MTMVMIVVTVALTITTARELTITRGLGFAVEIVLFGFPCFTKRYAGLF